MNHQHNKTHSTTTTKNLVRRSTSIALICAITGLLGCNSTSQKTLYDTTDNQPLYAQSASAPSSNIKAGNKLSGLAVVTHKGRQVMAIASEKTGITLAAINSDSQALNTQVISQLKGSYELLDSRQTSQRQWLITADAQTGQPVIFSATQDSDLISATATALRETRFQTDALCLYLDKQNNLFAFMLDGYGGGEMRWLWDARKDSLVDITVKQLSLPPGSESCAVDDASAALLVAEEEFGVWQYPAEPEGAWQRHLVAAVKPWGKVQASPIGVKAIAPYHFALFSEQGAAVYRLNNKGTHAEVVTPVKLNAQEIADVAWLNDKLLVLDEAADTIVSAPLAAKKIEKSIATAKQQLAPLPAVYPTVTAKAQTPAMQRRGDAADDPAIWVHPIHPEKSLVLGTNKKWGLFVYDLQGNETQAIATGHINNVDIRQGVRLAPNKKAQDIAIASNRSDNTLTVYTLNNGHVKQVANIATGLNDVYGVCLYAPNKQALYAFINDKDGRFKQYQLIENTAGIDANLVREFHLDSQPEACVANDATGELFIGEEDAGVWLFDANPTASISGRLIAAVGDVLVADVEGLGLINNALGNYLVVSSQGDNSYAIYQAEAPYNYVGSFRVGLNSDNQIDGTSETDGIAITGAALGEHYPQGLLVIQDGFNLMPSQPQNFKYVSWQDVINELAK